METDRLGAVVLTGGSAVRLDGADKASIELGGLTLLEHALGALVDVDEVVVVGDHVPTTRPVTFTREDPRHGGLRLLTMHGVFFEFLPCERAHEPDVPRLGVEEVEAGAPYEVAVSSPAGLWACRVGLTVSFERTDPPLLRVLPSARPEVPAAALTAREPRPQSAGTPAARPESSARSPW